MADEKQQPNRILMRTSFGTFEFCQWERGSPSARLRLNDDFVTPYAADAPDRVKERYDQFSKYRQIDIMPGDYAVLEALGKLLDPTNSLRPYVKFEKSE